MNYPIAGGVTKDILVGDFVLVSQDMSTGKLQANGFVVLGFDTDGTNMQVRTLDNTATTWLTSTQILKVWRNV